MALLLVEGFDDGLYTKRGYVGAGGAVDAAYGRNGKGVRLGDNYSAGFIVGTAGFTSDATIILGANVYIAATSPANAYIFGLHSASYSSTSSYGCVVRYDEVNKRLFVSDVTGTINTAAVNSVLIGAWYHIELKVTANNTTGSWELRVDGDTYLSAINRDTSRLSIPDPYIMFVGSSTLDIDAAYCDDVHICDSTGSFNNDFLGISKVVTLLPNGNGNSSVMVGSDGNSVDNYLLVDNNAAIPPAVTEYVGGATEGDKDTYAMEDLAGTPTVHGVVTSIYATKSDVGAKYMRPVIRSGGTDYPGTSKALPTTPAYISQDEAWEVDPATSTTWLYGGVNSAEVGQEARDS
jgi:hypothetical protein